jgi:type II secretory ATPase GspE/PulE/Tfp pilus assembly ATPase PilB-like protein
VYPGGVTALPELLVQTPLFADFQPRHVEQLAQRMTRHDYATNADIVRQGEPGDALYIIESGLVGVFVRDERTGVVRMVSQLGPRQSFGEMAVITTTPRIATCTALEPTVVHRLAREVFDAVASKLPAVALAIARTLADRLQRLTSERDVPWMSLAGKNPDRRLLASAPEGLMRLHRAVPIELDKYFLTLGMVDPQDAGPVQVFREIYGGVRLKLVAISADDFERFVGITPPAQVPAARTSQAIDVSADTRPPITFIEDDDSRASRTQATGPQLLAMVDEIIATGLAIGASDIHIEHERKAISVRYRVDGALRPRAQPIASELGRPLVSRFKLLAKLDITETRRPQDGRISPMAGKRMVDLRLSTMPAKFGEKLVLRILDAEANIAELKGLLVHEPVRKLFSEMVFRPHGLVLVTGPTGSGKSTTMYSALTERRRPDQNIVTVEDPIEYHLDGVTQIQVQAEVTSFGSILRAMLRQDPDVIMVGELRDRETAKMAVEASTTGHLVISSMHTNSALEAMYRLLDMGVERYVVANALLGVLHQRLVRRICTACSERCDYPPPIVEGLCRAGVLSADEPAVLRRGAGCARCSQSGFKGRVSLTELLVVNDPVRTAFSAGADVGDLKPVAQHTGALLELSRCAGALLGGGLTTPGEVMHLVQSVGR